MADRLSVYTIPGSFHAVENLWRIGLLFTLEMIFSAHILSHFRRETFSKVIRYKREKLLLENLNLKWAPHSVSALGATFYNHNWGGNKTQL